MPSVQRQSGVRQNKYLNNVVEQDHRAVKRIIKPMIGFKNFRCARSILSGIEIAHMIRKGQMCDDGVASTAAEQFYSLSMQAVLFNHSYLLTLSPLTRHNLVAFGVLLCNGSEERNERVNIVNIAGIRRCRPATKLATSCINRRDLARCARQRQRSAENAATP